MSTLQFEDWMLDVDRLMTRESGLGVDDLSDYNYRDAYNDQVTPAEVVADVLAENNYPH